MFSYTGGVGGGGLGSLSYGRMRRRARASIGATKAVHDTDTGYSAELSTTAPALECVIVVGGGGS